VGGGLGLGAPERSSWTWRGWFGGAGGEQRLGPLVSGRRGRLHPRWGAGDCSNGSARRLTAHSPHRHAANGFPIGPNVTRPPLSWSYRMTIGARPPPGASPARRRAEGWARVVGTGRTATAFRCARCARATRHFKSRSGGSWSALSMMHSKISARDWSERWCGWQCRSGGDGPRRSREDRFSAGSESWPNRGDFLRERLSGVEREYRAILRNGVWTPSRERRRWWIRTTCRMRDEARWIRATFGGQRDVA